MVVSWCDDLVSINLSGVANSETSSRLAKLPGKRVFSRVINTLPSSCLELTMVFGFAKYTKMRPSPLSPRLKSKPLMFCSGINDATIELVFFKALDALLLIGALFMWLLAGVSDLLSVRLKVSSTLLPCTFVSKGMVSSRLMTIRSLSGASAT